MKMTSQLLRAQKPRVLVVGGGPVGLATAFMLEKLYNVPTRVVERQRSPTSHPQAHFINLRTMEVLYATMPEFHDRLLAQAAPSVLVREGKTVCVNGVTTKFWVQRLPCVDSGATTFTALE